MTRAEVQIEITQPNGDYQRISTVGTVATSLRALVIRLGDSCLNDAEMQQLVEAVAAVDLGQRPTAP